MNGILVLSLLALVSSSFAGPTQIIDYYGGGQTKDCHKVKEIKKEEIFPEKLLFIAISYAPVYAVGPYNRTTENAGLENTGKSYRGWKKRDQ